MKTFPLRVLAPERTFFDGACTSLTVPSIDGMYGLTTKDMAAQYGANFY